MSLLAVDYGDLRAGDRSGERRIWYVFHHEHSTKVRYDCVVISTRDYTYVSDLIGCLHQRLIGSEITSATPVMSLSLSLPLSGVGAGGNGGGSSQSKQRGSPIQYVRLNPDELVDELPPTVSLNPSTSEFATPLSVLVVNSNQAGAASSVRARLAGGLDSLSATPTKLQGSNGISPTPSPSAVRRPQSATVRSRGPMVGTSGLDPAEASSPSASQSYFGNRPQSPAGRQHMSVATSDIEAVDSLSKRGELLRREELDSLVTLNNASQRVREMLENLASLEKEAAKMESEVVHDSLRSPNKADGNGNGVDDLSGTATGADAAAGEENPEHKRKRESQAIDQLYLWNRARDNLRHNLDHQLQGLLLSLTLLLQQKGTHPAGSDGSTTANGAGPRPHPTSRPQSASSSRTRSTAAGGALVSHQTGDGHAQGSVFSTPERYEVSNAESIWNVELVLPTLEPLPQNPHSAAFAPGEDPAAPPSIYFTIPRLSAEVLRGPTKMQSLIDHLSAYTKASLKMHSATSNGSEQSNGVASAANTMSLRAAGTCSRLDAYYSKEDRLSSPYSGGTLRGYDDPDFASVAGHAPSTNLGPCFARVQYLDSEFGEYVLVTKRTIGMLCGSRALRVELQLPPAFVASKSKLSDFRSEEALQQAFEEQKKQIAELEKEKNELQEKLKYSEKLRIAQLDVGNQTKESLQSSQKEVQDLNKLLANWRAKLVQEESRVQELTSECQRLREEAKGLGLKLDEAVKKQQQENSSSSPQSPSKSIANSETNTKTVEQRDSETQKEPTSTKEEGNQKGNALGDSKDVAVGTPRPAPSGTPASAPTPKPASESLSQAAGPDHPSSELKTILTQTEESDANRKVAPPSSSSRETQTPIHPQATTATQPSGEWSDARKLAMDESHISAEDKSVATVDRQPVAETEVQTSFSNNEASRSPAHTYAVVQKCNACQTPSLLGGASVEAQWQRRKYCSYCGTVDAEHTFGRVYLPKPSRGAPGPAVAVHAATGVPRDLAFNVRHGTLIRLSPGSAPNVRLGVSYAGDWAAASSLGQCRLSLRNSDEPDSTTASTSNTNTSGLPPQATTSLMAASNSSLGSVGKALSFTSVWRVVHCDEHGGCNLVLAEHPLFSLQCAGAGTTTNASTAQTVTVAPNDRGRGDAWRFVLGPEGGYFLLRERDGAPFWMEANAEGSTLAAQFTCGLSVCSAEKLWTVEVVEESNPVPAPYEECRTCGGRTHVPFDDIQYWTDEGVCAACGVLSKHRLVDRDEQTQTKRPTQEGAGEVLVTTPRIRAAYELCTNCGATNPLPTEDIPSWVSVGTCSSCLETSVHALVAPSPQKSSKQNNNGHGDEDNNQFIIADPKLDAVAEQLQGILQLREEVPSNEFSALLSEAVKKSYFAILEEKAMDSELMGQAQVGRPHVVPSSIVVWE
jgi:hypothetical protein